MTCEDEALDRIRGKGVGVHWTARARDVCCGAADLRKCAGETRRLRALKVRQEYLSHAKVRINSRRMAAGQQADSVSSSVTQHNGPAFRGWRVFHKPGRRRRSTNSKMPTTGRLASTLCMECRRMTGRTGRVVDRRSRASGRVCNLGQGLRLSPSPSSTVRRHPCLGDSWRRRSPNRAPQLGDKINRDGGRDHLGPGSQIDHVTIPPSPVDAPRSIPLARPTSTT